MNRLDIPERNITIEFPSQIDELNEKQFVFFVEQLLSCTAGDITLPEFKIRMTARFLDLKLGWAWHRMPEQDKLDAMSELTRLSNLMDGFFTTEIRNNQPVSVFKLDFIRNFIPKICGKYYGPADALTDITFCEYRQAHNYFNAYQNSGSDDDLNHLIAILYRPKKKFLWLIKRLPWFDGREKITFSSKSNPLFLEKRTKKIAKMPLPIRYGIYLFFSGCEQFLATGTPTIDGIPIRLSVLYEKSEGSSSDPGTGLYGILCTLSESKVFGSLMETDNQGLYDILLRLYQVVMQMKQMNEKTKNNGAS